MSDVFIPGVRSRLNTDQLVEDIMRLERIPQDRAMRGIEELQVQRSYWQEVGRRVTALRDSSRALFGFQNPFTERTAFSSNNAILGASATRQAAEQSYSFTVLQTAAADRFISRPADENMQIESGLFVVSIGEEEVALNFEGGSLREFSEALNREGGDALNARLVTVQPGTVSLALESQITGAGNRMEFSEAAAPLMVQIGMMEVVGNFHREIAINQNSVAANQGGSVNITPEGMVEVPAQTSVSIVNAGEAIVTDLPLTLRIETMTQEIAPEAGPAPQPPAGPSLAQGSITFGGINIENSPSAAPFPRWQPPAEELRVDNLSVLSLSFTDGSVETLAAISDSDEFQGNEFNLTQIAAGRTILSVNVENTNTHRQIAVQNIEIFNSAQVEDSLVPVNAISTARDAIIEMEGIEMSRPSNEINDILPGVSLSLRAASTQPVQISVGADTDAIIDAIIMFVGNYNRLMAEINILTSTDPGLVDELVFLTPDEADVMRERVGAFVGDSTLNSMRNNLQRAVSAPYPLSDGGVAMLSQIGISTNVRPQGGFIDTTRLRGYLEIDENMLITAIETNLSGVRELFGNNAAGGIITDTGVAFMVDSITHPFVQTGGIISIRTNTIDSRIANDQRRVDAMEQQLASREAQLRIQYSQMEAAFMRMEQMTNSFDNFSQQMRGNNR